MSDNSGETQRALGRIEGRLDQLIAQIGDNEDKMHAMIKSHDARMRKVETANAKYGALAGGIVSVCIGLATGFVKSQTGGGS